MTTTDSFELDFPTAFDFYLQTVYDLSLLSWQLFDHFTSVGASRILDCAAGSGMPAIALRKLGLPISCSDGSPEMVERFRANAEAIGDRDHGQCDVVDWSELQAPNGELYDYVMCRGNSLVYATTWDTAADDAVELDRLVLYLRRFASIIEPGGILHVDAPEVMSSGSRKYEGFAVAENGDKVPVSVIESVIERVTSRYWTCIVDAGTRGRCSFAMHSAKLTVDVLQELLLGNGFESCERLVLDGERAMHPTLLARRSSASV